MLLYFSRKRPKWAPFLMFAIITYISSSKFLIVPLHWAFTHVWWLTKYVRSILWYLMGQWIYYRHILKESRQYKEDRCWNGKSKEDIPTNVPNMTKAPWYAGSKVVVEHKSILHANVWSFILSRLNNYYTKIHQYLLRKQRGISFLGFHLISKRSTYTQRMLSRWKSVTTTK